MSKYQIESAIPFLPAHRPHYPFAAMAVGESFGVVGAAEARRVRNAAYQFSQKWNRSLEKKVKEGALTQEQAQAEIRIFSLRLWSPSDSDQAGIPEEERTFRIWRQPVD